ncbi:hypothetical protein LCGC14_2193790, partial [marine sediment metagenome]
MTFQKRKKICESLYTLRDPRNWEEDINIFDKLYKKIELYFKMSNL